MPRVQNLITFSEQFDNAAWTKTNLTVSANTTDTLDPLGTNTADKLTDSVDGGAVQHRFLPSGPTGVVGTTYTSSIFVKAGTDTFLCIGPNDANIQVAFNLTTGAVTVLTGIVISTSMIAVGNGWWRCSVTYVMVSAGTLRAFYYMATSAALTYTGAGTGTLYVWGASEALCAGLPEYVQTVATAVNNGPVRYIVPKYQNLLKFSEQFDNAAWSKLSCTISANTSDTLDPLGGNTADKMIDSVDGGAQTHRVDQQAIPYTPTTVGELYTVSIFAKAGTNGFIGINPDAGTSQTSFNLSTQEFTKISDSTLQIVGFGTSRAPNGWNRYWVTYKKASGGPWSPLFYLMKTAGSPTYQGDGTGTMYLWGAQDVQSNWPGLYTQTITVPINNGPPRGLAVQPQNFIANSEQFDNATWTKDTGCVVTANQTANPVDGAVTADLIDFTTVSVNSGIYSYTHPAGTPAPTLDMPVRGYWFTKSVWLKGVLGGEQVRLATPTNPATNSGALVLTTSWQRFAWSIQAPDDYTLGNTDVGGLWIQKISGNQFYAWGAQVSRTNYAPDYVRSTTPLVIVGRGSRILVP